MISLRIASWNCQQGIKDDRRKLEVIENIDADILVLQECLKEETGRLGGIWVPSNTERGIGVFSNRFTFETTPEQTFSEISAVRYSVKKSDTHIFNMVCVWLKKEDGAYGTYDEAMLRATPTLLKLTSQKPCFLLGDFNFWVGPFNGIERFSGVQNPCEYTGPNDFFARLVCSLYNLGMVSAQHEIKNEKWGAEKEKTFSSSRDGKQYMDDYIFAPREWISKSTSEISVGGKYNFANIQSDHLPLILDVQIPEL